jgi:hypothetical protein
MKNKLNIIYAFAFAMIALMVSSCDQSELYPRYGEKDGQAFVAFEQGSASFSESVSVNAADGSSSNLVDNTYQVRLERSAADISSALTVSVSASAVYAADSDFGDAGADASALVSFADNLQEIVFEANEATTTFTVQSTENLETQGDIIITLSIESVSSSNYQIGFQSGQTRSDMTLTVIDDDCPIDIPGVWEGIYQVTEFPAAPGSFNEGFSVGSAVGLQVELVLDESDPLGVSAILKPTAASSLLVDEVPLTFVTCPETVLIGDGTYRLTFNQNSAPAVIFRADEPETFGNGTYSPDGSGMTIVVSYGNTSGANFDEFLLTLERVEE